MSAVEVVTDRPERYVAILASTEQIDVTTSRYAGGENGPEEHVGRDVRARAPGVVHTFRNESGEDARFLNFHAPSTGFAEYLSGRNANFDTFDPPPDGGRPASDALIREPGAGARLAFGPGEVVFKAEGAGWLSLMEATLGAGYPGPVPHFHRGFVDSFYVLEGVLTLRVGDAVVEAPAGSFTAATPGTVHTFSNPGDEPVRMLNVMAPGGFEQYLRAVAAEVPAGGAPDPALMAEIAQRHDFVPAP